MEETKELEGRKDINQLMLKSEAVVDDVLKPQLEALQKHQEETLKILLDVQLLADHIELLQLQRQHRLREQERQLQELRELRVLRAVAAEEHIKPVSDATLEYGATERVEDTVPAEALTDVGCHFFLKVVGDDIGRILVNVGFQFFLEMTLEEASEFLRRKESLLLRKYEYWSLKCSGVKAQIHLLLQAVSALIEEPAL